MPSENRITGVRLDVREISKYLRHATEVQAGISQLAQAVASGSGIDDVTVETDVSDRFRALVTARHGNRSTEELGARLIASATNQGLEVKPR